MTKEQNGVVISVMYCSLQ